MSAETNPVRPGIAETPEPKAERTAAPVWLFVLLLVLLFGGFVYFDQRSAWCEPLVYAPYHSLAELNRYQPSEGPMAAMLQLGRQKYDQVCALCHNVAGTGNPNQAPPFIGSEWVLGNPKQLLRIPLYGLQGPITVKGQQYTFASSMPAMGVTMSEEELAAVLSYMRQSWGNKAEPITAAQVKAVKAEVGAHGQPFTAEEVQRAQ
jgi:mono/diheme cytochrome c family protein